MSSYNIFSSLFFLPVSIHSSKITESLKGFDERSILKSSVRYSNIAFFDCILRYDVVIIKSHKAFSGVAIRKANELLINSFFIPIGK